MFPPFRLDPTNAQLWRNDEKISLRRKTFDVLLYLVDHPGQLVTKATLLDALWADVTVTDSMPAICVAELRKALGDEARTPRFIETIHGRGYRFVAKVTTAARAQATSKPLTVATRPKMMMVGREDEIAQMQGWYSQVLEGQRRVVFIAGEAGIGKTAFVKLFLDKVVQENAARFARGQCIEQYGAGEPYMPVLEALSRLGKESGERVIEILDKFAPTWLAQLPALQTREERVRLQAQNVTQQRMLREIVLALEALAEEAPLVLVLEDLHWSDFSTLEMISAVARQNEPARLFVVGTYRPVEVLAYEHPLRAMKQELELHRYCAELRLKDLSEEDITCYLAKRFSDGSDWPFDSLAHVVHQRTGGNPLFMINVIDYLADAGLLVGSHEASVENSAETRSVDCVEVPRSVRQMIERNLERLNPEDQAVLESASVAGAEFSTAAVAAALERSQDEVESCCTRLSRREQFVSGRGLIEWPDGTVAAAFRFRHALYQEVLYGLLAPGRRAQLHRLIAVREETAYGERVDEVASELAHHYRRANDRNKAVRYLQLAGERAVARGAVVEAEDHYRRALDLLAELPQAVERDSQELALQIALGSVLWSSRSWAHPDARRSYARALELGEKLGETGQPVAALKGLVASAFGGGHFKSARELSERMLMAAEHGGDRAALCAAHTVVGESLIWRAQYVEAQKHLELGSSYYDKVNVGELGLMGIEAPALAAIVVLLRGFPDRACQLMNEALQRSKCHDDLFKAGLAHMWGGMFCGLLRDVEGTLEHAQALGRLAVKQPVWSGLNDAFMGKALMFQGKWQDGVRYVRKAIAFHKTVGLVSQLMWARLDETEFFINQGEIDDGLALSESTLADSEELAQVRSPALRQRADLLARTNADALKVDAAYRAAIECPRAEGAKYYELQAATHFARWLESQGRASEAHNLLGGIYGWFTEGLDTAALKDAKALLDEFSNKPGAPRRSKSPKRS